MFLHTASGETVTFNPINHTYTLRINIDKGVDDLVQQLMPVVSGRIELAYRVDVVIYGKKNTFENAMIVLQPAATLAIRLEQLKNAATGVHDRLFYAAEILIEHNLEAPKNARNRK